jgi:hypothetical protein
MLAHHMDDSMSFAIVDTIFSDSPSMETQIKHQFNANIWDIPSLKKGIHRKDTVSIAENIVKWINMIHEPISQDVLIDTDVCSSSSALYSLHSVMSEHICLNTADHLTINKNEIIDTNYFISIGFLQVDDTFSIGIEQQFIYWTKWMLTLLKYSRISNRKIEEITGIVDSYTMTIVNLTTCIFGLLLQGIAFCWSLQCFNVLSGRLHLS